METHDSDTLDPALTVRDTCDWHFSLPVSMQAIIASLVQLFFAYRVMVLVKNVWIVGVVVLCAIAGCGESTFSRPKFIETHAVSGILTAFEVGITPHFVDFRHFKVERRSSSVFSHLYLSSQWSSSG